MRRGLLAVLVTTAVTLPLSATARAVTPAPAPAQLPAVAADTLDARYAANREAVTEAARMAVTHGDEERAGELRALAAPGRNLLTFDGRGDGRAVEVYGDLAGAERIAVLVPGSDTTLSTYDSGGPTAYKSLAGGARAVKEEIRRQAPAATVAVVAWLGYATPATVSTDVLTPGRADDGADELHRFTQELRRANRGAKVSLLCHSYGSVVCGRAATGLDVADIAFYGSPGVGAGDSVATLRTRATVWAGRGAEDWIADVPHTEIALLGTTIGFGADPVAPGFGARLFDAGVTAHSEYLRPGSVSLRNLARIAAGSYGAVTGS